MKRLLKLPLVAIVLVIVAVLSGCGSSEKDAMRIVLQILQGPRDDTVVLRVVTTPPELEQQLLTCHILLGSGPNVCFNLPGPVSDSIEVMEIAHCRDALGQLNAQCITEGGDILQCNAPLVLDGEEPEPTPRSGGGGGGSSTPIPTPPPAPTPPPPPVCPEVVITGHYLPKSVASGTVLTVSYSSSDSDGCNVTSSAGWFRSGLSAVGEYSTDPITVDQTLTFTCTSPCGDKQITGTIVISR